MSAFEQGVMSLRLRSEGLEQVQVPASADDLALVGAQDAGLTLGDGHATSNLQSAGAVLIYRSGSISDRVTLYRMQASVKPRRRYHSPQRRMQANATRQQ